MSGWTTALLGILLACTAHGQGPPPTATRSLADEASGLELTFPAGVKNVERHEVGMSQATDGRTTFPRFTARTPEGVDLEAALVPYPPKSASLNPRVRLAELLSAMTSAVKAKIERRTYGWHAGFPSADATLTTSKETGRRTLRVRIILQPRDVLLLQAIASSSELVGTDEIETFFDGARRSGVEPPASFLYAAGEYSFRYPAGTKLSPLDDGVLLETVDGSIFLRLERTTSETTLADLAGLLGEEVARSGPVVVTAGPRFLGRGQRRCASLTIASKSEHGPAEERLVRYYPCRSGRLMVTAARRTGQKASAAGGIDVVMASIETTKKSSPKSEPTREDEQR